MGEMFKRLTSPPEIHVPSVVSRVYSGAPYTTPPPRRRSLNSKTMKQFKEVIDMTNKVEKYMETMELREQLEEMCQKAHDNGELNATLMNDILNYVEVDMLEVDHITETLFKDIVENIKNDMVDCAWEELCHNCDYELEPLCDTFEDLFMEFANEHYTEVMEYNSIVWDYIIPHCFGV